MKVGEVCIETNDVVKIADFYNDSPKLQPWGAKNMHLCDPDGNHIYFRSLPE